MQAVTRAARPAFAVAPRRGALQVLAAHKKGSGSTKNGRDSNAQRRGVKVYGGQAVKAGGIIVRQVGSQWYPGENCGEGKDFTIYSQVDGIVVYSKKPVKPEINVYPLEHEKAKAAIAATHTKQPADGVSRKEKRKAQYSSRRAQGTLAVAQVAVPTLP